MKNAKSIKTPIVTNRHLNLDLGGTLVDQKVYRFIIRSLVYLCASGPDIMLSMRVCKIQRHTQRLSFKGG
jgi:hypothetical protein